MHDYYPPKADFIVKDIYKFFDRVGDFYTNVCKWKKKNIKRFEKKTTLKYFVHPICIQEFNNAYAKHLHFHNTYLQM